MKSIGQIQLETKFPIFIYMIFSSMLGFLLPNQVKNIFCAIYNFGNVM